MLKKNGLHRFLLVFLLCFAIFSCSDSNPSIGYTYGTVVFDYKTEKSLPDVRLSVYSSLKSDGRRCLSYSIKNADTNYIWTARNLDLISSNGSSYIGWSNFYPYENEKIPMGRYVLTYTDVAGEECSSNFSVSYPENNYSMKLSDFIKNISPSMEEKIILFNKNDEIIYYDDFNESWTNWNSIHESYSDAAKKRRVYMERNHSACVLFPPETESDSE